MRMIRIVTNKKTSLITVFCALNGIFLFSPIFAFAAAGDIVFTEIAYDLKGADEGHEWVEIYNTLSSEIDITGWKFNDGDNHLLNIPPKNGGQGAIIIPAGGYAVLADDAAVFLNNHPGFSGTVIDTVMSLNNTAATLTLFDKDGIAIDSMSYQKEWGANGNGLMLEKIGQVWKESAVEGGTPDSANGGLLLNDESTVATSTEPIISSAPRSPPLTADAGENIVALTGDEIFFEGSKSQGGPALTFLWNFGDGATQEGRQVSHRYSFPGNYIVTLKISDGVQSAEDQLRADIYSNSIALSEFVPNPADKENWWIELSNKAPYGVDISDWGLGARDSRPDFKMPENTFLSGNGFLALRETTTSISLPESGTVYLFYPNGQIAEKVEYKNAPENFVAVLTADGRYEWSAEQTPGMKNIAVSSAVSDKPIESSPVSDNRKTSSQAREKSSFVEYKIHNGIKSFIAEPVLAYSVQDAVSLEKSSAPAGTALSYFAFDQYRYVVLAVAWLAFFLWLFRGRRGWASAR